MVDYSMGSALWQQRSKGERIATIGISINYVQTAREGDVICESVVDRRNDRIAVMRSEVRHEDGRLLATAIGSFAIFPRERLGGHERGPDSPAPSESASVAKARDQALEPLGEELLVALGVGDRHLHHLGDRGPRPLARIRDAAGLGVEALS